MADLLVRNIDPKLKREIARRARKQGHSMSAEVNALLGKVLGAPEPQKKMGTWMASLVAPEDRGDDLVFEYRGDFPKPPEFD